MYLLIYCFKLAPWGITIKKIQNECIARSKSFPNFKMLDSFIIAMEMRHKEDGRLPCSSACKTKQGTMMSSTKAAFCGQSVNGLKEHNSKADPYSYAQEQALTADLGRDEWVSSYTHLWAHSGERQPREDDDCLQETIFPFPSCTGHTLSPAMVWLEEFFPCTHTPVCSNKSGTFFLHLLQKGARKPAKQVGVFSSGFATPLVAPEVPRAWQDLVFRARAEQSHRVNDRGHLMTVYCSHLQ